MRGGFYLSTYLSPPGISQLLDLEPRHDNNISLWKLEDRDVTLVRHWELERLSGIKQHGRAFENVAQARSFIASLLGWEGLGWDDIIASWGTPGLDHGSAYGSPNPVLPMHGVAHAFSSLMLDSERFQSDRILCFAPDGGPDHVLGRTTNWYVGGFVDRGELELFAIESPGRLYDSASRRYGMRAGTLMALAGACAFDASVDVDLAALIQTTDFRGDGLIAGRRVSAVADGERVVATLDRLVRRSLQPIPTAEGFSAEHVVVSTVMALVQRCCDLVMERNVERFVARTSVSPETVHLGMAGGYALNCPSNVHLRNRYGFRSLVAPPCANDSGQALGVGLAAIYEQLPDMRFRLENAYQGQPVSELEAAREIFEADILSVDVGLAQFSKDLEEAPVVWLVGACEIGPRALGHRSLLGDPRSQSTKHRLNQIKGRQWWRPVAPLVLESEVAAWFEAGRPSPYMLETFQVRRELAAQIPAVCHVDGSARLQTIGAADDELLIKAVNDFYRSTGVPMVCNTSLNGAGQPILQSAVDAFAFAFTHGLPVVYVDGVRHRLGSAPHRGAQTAIAPLKLPLLTDEARSRANALANPYGLAAADLYGYLTRPELHSRDITTERGAIEVATAMRDVYCSDPDDKAWVEAFLERRRGASAVI